MSSKTAYDVDFYAWTQEQCVKLRAAGAENPRSDIDWRNVAEEIGGVGKRDHRELRSHATHIMKLLLLLEHRPGDERRLEWEHDLLVHRFEAEMIVDDCPTLVEELERELAGRYHRAVRLASVWLGCSKAPYSTLPKECPYSSSEILDRGSRPVEARGFV